MRAHPKLRAVMRAPGTRTFLAFMAGFLFTACLQRPTPNRNVIVIGMVSGPNNLDPRIGTDDASAKSAQLMFNGLMKLNENLRPVPDLAERLDHPDPLTYIVGLKRGVKFHDGRELTSADAVYTYRSLLDPAFVSPYKGAFRALASIEAVDRYTVVFHLKQPFAPFLVNLVTPPIVPEGAGAAFREHPIGTGPYRFLRY